MSRFTLAVVFAFGLLLGAQSLAAPIQQKEIDIQNKIFLFRWETDLQWKLDELPSEGTVPEFRVPYSGHDYPDKGGGTNVVVSGNMSPLAKYDQAFNRGRSLAVAWENQDVQESKGPERYGLLGLRRQPLFPRLQRQRAPGWYGHCNGWTAASIRHAEPKHSVVRNGVTFTPADIKALLAEVYMYADTEFLGGEDHAINPGLLHVVLANWLGRGEHPVAMESALGEVVFNYPIHAYKATVTQRTSRQTEVNLDVTYAYNSNREVHKSPRISKTKKFHYLLDLDDEGRVTGGAYYRDSVQIDMLWVPLNPRQGGQEGNERGCPHIDVKQVMLLWRDSVPEEERDKWLNIDPTFPKVE